MHAGHIAWEAKSVKSSLAYGLSILITRYVYDAKQWPKIYFQHYEFANAKTVYDVVLHRVKGLSREVVKSMVTNLLRSQINSLPFYK